MTRIRIGRPGRGARSFPWPLLGGALLWVALALLLPALDPRPRSEWPSYRWYPGDGYERLWCPPCDLVEEHLTDHRWLNQLVGIGQYIALSGATAVAGGAIRGALAEGVGGGDGDSRASRIERERIQRSMGSWRRRRDRADDDD